MKMPSKEEIKEFLESLTDDDYSILLPDDASDVDKIKFELCRHFIVYLREEGISQTELANMLEVDKSRINWIVKYRIEHFSIDYLYTLIKKLIPNLELRLVPAI